MTQYYLYRIERERAGEIILLGRTQDEILKTIESYAERIRSKEFDIPKRETIIPVSGLIIYCFNEKVEDGKLVSISFQHGIEFKVAAHAYEGIKSLAEEKQDYIEKERKRGELYGYKFTGQHITHLIPRNLVDEIRLYPWQDHEAKVRAWLGKEVIHREPPEKLVINPNKYRIGDLDE